MQVQKASPRQLGGFPSAALRATFHIATERFIGALHNEALGHAVSVGGYRADYYYNGSHIFVIADRAWSTADKDVAALLEVNFAGLLQIGWLFFIDFVIPEGKDEAGTPVVDVIFSETYEVVSP